MYIQAMQYLIAWLREEHVTHCHAVNCCCSNILVTLLEWSNGAELLFAYSSDLMSK